MSPAQNTGPTTTSTSKFSLAQDMVRTAGKRAVGCSARTTRPRSTTDTKKREPNKGGEGNVDEKEPGRRPGRRTRHECRSGHGTVNHLRGQTGHRAPCMATTSSSRWPTAPSVTPMSRADFLFEVDSQKVPARPSSPAPSLPRPSPPPRPREVVKSVEVRKLRSSSASARPSSIVTSSVKSTSSPASPRGFILYRDGKPVPVEALAGGDRVTAHIVHTEETIITEEEMNVAGTAPKAPPKPRPVAMPKPNRLRPRHLPRFSPRPAARCRSSASWASRRSPSASASVSSAASSTH